jgi:GNAT superfamily N-acetyltransferase
MNTIRVRPFHRRDRQQLADLVNAHAAAVVPGMRVSVSTVLSELERQSREFIVEPWVSERVTLVAEQRDRVAAAAHLLRFSADERVGTTYRGAGEIHWLLFWPEAPAGNPYWPDAADAAGELVTTCIRQLGKWGVTRQYADGDLPVPGVYGVPEQWPHIRSLYQRAGFTHTGHTEIVCLAEVAGLLRPAEPPIAGLALRRAVGMNGTRLSAVLGEEVIGYIEVGTFEEGERLSRHSGWADVGNLHVSQQYRRRGTATWLLGQAAHWLRLAQVERLLDYAWLESPGPADRDHAGYRAFLQASGFLELTRTKREWTRAPNTAS